MQCCSVVLGLKLGSIFCHTVRRLPPAWSHWDCHNLGPERIQIGRYSMSESTHAKAMSGCGLLAMFWQMACENTIVVLECTQITPFLIHLVFWSLCSFSVSSTKQISVKQLSGRCFLASQMFP
jgi:hypothetical protein